VTYLRGRSPRFVTVCVRGGVQFVKSIACAYVMNNLWFQKITILLHKYNNYRPIIAQQILVFTFEFTFSARGFMIMSCAARWVKKVGQYCYRYTLYLYVALLLSSSTALITVKYRPTSIFGEVYSTELATRPNRLNKQPFSKPLYDCCCRLVI